MASQFEIRGLEDVTTLLDQLPERTFEDVKEVFKEGVTATHREVTGRIISGPLHSRSGEMKRSFKFQIKGTSIDSIKASVFSGAVKGKPLVYVPVHEFGAEDDKAIKAKDKYRGVEGGPYLNIPLPPNLHPSGVMKMNAREVFQKGGKIYQSRKGNWIVGLKDGTPMFILRKKVEIKARLGFYDTAEKQTEIIMKKLSSMLPESWSK